MKSRTKVVIIGGGIAGCSALYHLVLEGWNDAVLVERDELTSGTTWHSAAQVPNLAPNQVLIALRSYTIGLYKSLADDPEYPINYHHGVGGVRLITDQRQLDACHHVISAAKGVGVTFDLIAAEEIKRRNPLIDPEGVIAGLWDPLDGDIDPAQLCQALARKSRQAGAEIYRRNPVHGLTQKADHHWLVHTRNGDIECEYVVNAAGYRANEVGAMMGVGHPVAAMEHMYFLTDDIEELAGLSHPVSMVRCPRDTFYMRQEKQGLLVGVYEYDCKTWGMDGIDPNFSSSLCADDLDRCLPKLAAVFRRVPCLREAGIKNVVNGPITYSADAGPLIGKVPGLRNAYTMCGIRVGIGEGGGYGKVLAQLMVHGEAEFDTWQLDPRRITDYATREYAAIKAIEDYRREFQWYMPSEHRPAGRPCKTHAIYPLLKAAGAEFGFANGWERVMFYKPGPDFIQTYGYQFPNWHEVVAEEVRAVVNGVGLSELGGFNRIEIKGSGVLDWLDTLLCGDVPRAAGKTGLCYFLTAKGNLAGEATISVLDRDTVWWGSAAAAEAHDIDWLSEKLPGRGNIRLRGLTDDFTALVLAGPRTRDLLSALSPGTDWSPSGFPALTLKKCHIGHFEALAISLSFSGELAWELHVCNEQLLGLYCALVDEGAKFGLRHFGMHAVDSMRLEKGYGHWKSEYITQFNPFEANLGRFVNLEKSFHGKKGLERRLDSGLGKRRVLMILNENKMPAQPEDSIMDGGNVIGTVTSAGWGYRVNKNLAMGYIDPPYSKPGTRVSLYVQGKMIPAAVCEDCLYDADNSRWRRS